MPRAARLGVAVLVSAALHVLAVAWLAPGRGLGGAAPAPGPVRQLEVIRALGSRGPAAPAQRRASSSVAVPAAASAQEDLGAPAAEVGDPAPSGSELAGAALDAAPGPSPGSGAGSAAVLSGTASPGTAPGAGSTLSQDCWSLVAEELASRASSRLPRSVRVGGRGGRLVLRFSLVGGGQVQGARIEESSGSARLDEAALGLLGEPLRAPRFAACAGEGRWPLSFAVGGAGTR